MTTIKELMRKAWYDGLKENHTKMLSEYDEQFERFFYGLKIYENEKNQELFSLYSEIELEMEKEVIRREKEMPCRCDNSTYLDGFVDGFKYLKRYLINR